MSEPDSGISMQPVASLALSYAAHDWLIAHDFRIIADIQAITATELIMEAPDDAFATEVLTAMRGNNLSMGLRIENHRQRKRPAVSKPTPVVREEHLTFSLSESRPLTLNGIQGSLPYCQSIYELIV